MTWDQVFLLFTFLATAWYAAGLWAMWRKAGPGHGLSYARAAAFFSSMALLLGATSAPVEALGEQSFWPHMLQHMLIILGAAPLLALSAPSLAFLKALPPGTSRALAARWNRSLLRRVWRQISAPPAACALFGLVFWASHAPLFYQAAIKHEALHVLEHGLYLLSAGLLWQAVLPQPGRRAGTAALEGILSLFVTMLHMSALGALMVFSSQAWYPLYAAQAVTWGTDPLLDQQLAGLIMWMPGGVLLTVVCAVLFEGWLRRLEPAQG